MGLHSTFANEIWLWRGQADKKYRLEPGMHTRIHHTPGLLVSEDNVRWATRQLLELARARSLDRLDGFVLPDLALLAHLQHHGAATPLLDVSVDPLVALWMASHAPGDSPEGWDDRGALLFAVRRPESDRWMEPLDARHYWSAGTDDVVSTLDDGMSWFRPPDVSERLRIQRGSFLLGRLAHSSGPTTLPLVYHAATSWLQPRITSIGKRGAPPAASTSVIAFRIRPKLKKEIRKWLSERAGLTQQVIYPTPWHRPFLDEFCRAYGRTRPIDY